MDDHPATRMSGRNRLFDLNTSIAEVLCRDRSENIRRHHAKRGTALYELTERAGAIAKNDAIFALFNDEEIAFDPTFQVNEDVLDLPPVKPVYLQRCPV